MTCIAGFVEQGVVWMGADSAGVRSDYGSTVRADGKLFRKGPMLMGFTSSFRMGQLLRHALTVPDHDPRVPVDRYLTTTFIDAVRQCLTDNGWARKKDGVEEGGCFLVGYRGRLFVVESDYQVGESVDGIAAAGCGYQIARGALYASPMRGRARLLTALKAAEVYSAGVRRPFHILSLRADAACREATP